MVRGKPTRKEHTQNSSPCERWLVLFKRSLSLARQYKLLLLWVGLIISLLYKAKIRARPNAQQLWKMTQASSRSIGPFYCLCKNVGIPLPSRHFSWPWVPLMFGFKTIPTINTFAALLVYSRTFLPPPPAPNHGFLKASLVGSLTYYLKKLGLCSLAIFLAMLTCYGPHHTKK